MKDYYKIFTTSNLRVFSRFFFINIENLITQINLQIQMPRNIGLQKSGNFKSSYLLSMVIRAHLNNLDPRLSLHYFP